MSELWDGVQKPTEAVESARLFLNGFIGSAQCEECGGDLAETTERTVAGLANVEKCEDCGRCFFQSMHDPTAVEQ